MAVAQTSCGRIEAGHLLWEFALGVSSFNSAVLFSLVTIRAFGV